MNITITAEQVPMLIAFYESEHAKLMQQAEAIKQTIASLKSNASMPEAKAAASAPAAEGEQPKRRGRKKLSETQAEAPAAAPAKEKKKKNLKLNYETFILKVLAERKRLLSASDLQQLLLDEHKLSAAEAKKAKQGVYRSLTILKQKRGAINSIAQEGSRGDVYGLAAWFKADGQIEIA